MIGVLPDNALLMKVLMEYDNPVCRKDISNVFIGVWVDVHDDTPTFLFGL